MLRTSFRNGRGHRGERLCAGDGVDRCPVFGECLRATPPAALPPLAPPFCRKATFPPPGESPLTQGRLWGNGLPRRLRLQPTPRGNGVGRPHLKMRGLAMTIIGEPIWSIGAGVAQRIFNPLVGGSNPSWITTGGLECPHRHLSNGPGVEVMGCAHGW